MSELEMAHEPRTVWILLSPAPDVEGQWTGHCLDFDVVSQGDSLEHAAMMVRAAIDLVIEEDAKAGLDPFDRDQAPDEDWEQLYGLLRHSVPLRRVPREKWSRIKLVALPYEVCVPETDEAPESDPLVIPEAWLTASLRDSNRDSGTFHSL
jgi:predicted RNase H-like HicB family nuclease